MLALALLPLLAHWLIVLKPEITTTLSPCTGGTGLRRQSPLVELRSSPFVWAVMANGGVWCYTAVYLLGGEFCRPFAQPGSARVICALIYRCALRWVDRSTALLLVALFAATPVVQLVTGSLFVETSMPYCCWRTRRSLGVSDRQGPCLPVGHGLSAGVRDGGETDRPPFALPIGLVLAWELIRAFRDGDNVALPRRSRLLAIAPQPTSTLVEDREPCISYLNSIFHSPYFSQIFSPTPLQ